MIQGRSPAAFHCINSRPCFPHLCRDGLPREGLLDNTLNKCQSYNGGDMTCYGHLLIDVKDRGHQEVSSHKILRDEHRRAKDTHKPCSSILARFGKGAMCQQGTKN